MLYLGTFLPPSGLLREHLSTKGAYPVPFPKSLPQITCFLLSWISVMPKLPSLSVISKKATLVGQEAPFPQLGPCYVERNTSSAIWDISP